MNPDDTQNNRPQQDEANPEVAGKDSHDHHSSGKKPKKDKKDPTAELQQQLDDLNDKYIRLYSEFDNYRKRSLKEKLDLGKTASAEIMLALLPVLDDFDRALKSVGTAKELDAVKDGIRLISDKLYGILAQKGLEPIDAIGKQFDTDFHEAITNIPSPTDDMKGKVFDETEKGYLLNGKVIRYAKVVVAN